MDVTANQPQPGAHLGFQLQPGPGPMGTGRTPATPAVVQGRPPALRQEKGLVRHLRDWSPNALWGPVQNVKQPLHQAGK